MEIDRASAALFGSRALTEAIGFVSVIYFARELGAAGLGIYFTFTTVVRVFGLFSKFGVPGAVVKRVSQSDSARQQGAYLTGGFALAGTSFALVVALAVVFEARLVAYTDLGAVLPLLALVLAASIGRGLAIAALRGERRVRMTAPIEFLDQIVYVGMSVVLLDQGVGVLSLIYGTVAGSLLAAALAALLSDVRFARPTRTDITHLFGFSKYTAGMNVSNLAYNWADTLVLAAFATKSVIGVYEVTWKLSAVTLLAAQVIGISLAPTVTGWHEAGELERIEAAFTQAVTYALALVVPGLVGVIVVGEEILRALYGYETGAVVLIILMAGQFAQAIKNVTQNTLFGIDRPEKVFWTNALTLGANVGLNLLLVPRHGMVGAAAATLSTAGIAAGSQLFFLRRHLSLTVDWQALGWQCGLALAMGAVLLFLSRTVRPRTATGVVGLVALGAAIYGAGILANSEIRARLLAVTPFGSS